MVLFRRRTKKWMAKDQNFANAFFNVRCAAVQREYFPDMFREINFRGQGLHGVQFIFFHSRDSMWCNLPHGLKGPNP